MAWDDDAARKNFKRRVERFAVALQDLRREAQALAEIRATYGGFGGGNLEFETDDGTAPHGLITAFYNKVIDDLQLFIENGVPAQQNRLDDTVAITARQPL